MLAIGIDPGTAICGFGLVEMVGNKLTPIHYGAVFTDKDMLPELRLKKIYDELSVLLDEYRPDVMSVEQLFFNRNVTTAISVGQARGVALLTAANRGIQITEFTPMQIKQAVVGYGGANKEQVTFMVQKLLNIRTKPKPDDVADALAVAICGLHTAATIPFCVTLQSWSMRGSFRTADVSEGFLSRLVVPAMFRRCRLKL